MEIATRSFLRFLTAPLAAMLSAGFAICTFAQQPVITSFDSAGTLTWSNAYSNAIASIERLTDVTTTGSAVTVVETLGISDGSTDYFSYTVDRPSIINPSVTISDGIYSWDDVTGASTNPPALIGSVVYAAGTVDAIYISHVPTAGTPIEVEYSYLPLTITQEWLSVHSEQATGDVKAVTADMSEDIGLFRVVNSPSTMVLVPGGSNSGTDPDFGAYGLTADSFFMDRYEVTNDEMVDVMQWAHEQSPPLITVSTSTVLNAEGDQQELLDLDASYCRITWNGSSFGMKATKGSGYPCVEVTWCGAVAYCNYRSRRDGLTPCYSFSDWGCDLGANGYRLPTSEEWEYAARGGAVSRRFPWGGDTISHSQANYQADSTTYSYDLSSEGYHPLYDTGGYPYTSPVGAFAANAYGLCDMAGNVVEWCHDWYPGYEGTFRVNRGGSWPSGADDCRVGSMNNGDRINVSRYWIGFRAVLLLGQ